MSTLEAIGVARFVAFTLVFTRISGLVLAAPLFSGQEVPARVRALLVLGITLVLAPTQSGTGMQLPDTLLDYLAVVATELVIGVLSGVGLAITISAFDLAGGVINQLAGLNLADVFSPGFDTEVPLLSQFLHLVAVAIFLSIGGHRWLIEGLMETFQVLPVGGGVLPMDFADVLVRLLTHSFLLTVRVAAPAAVALLLANLVLALIGRTVTQLNLLIVGFGINSLVAFSVLAFSLAGMGWVLEEQLQAALDLVRDALGLAAS